MKNALAILVLRKNGHFSFLLRQHKFEVLNLELIRTEPLDDQSELDALLKRIANYDGLFITSPAAAKVFADRLSSGGHNFLGKVYVLGDRSKRVLKSRGLDIVFRDKADTAEELIKSFPDAEFADKTFLFIRGERSMRTIPRILGATARIDEIPVYRTIDITPDAEFVSQIRTRLRRGEIGWLCFFSPSGIKSLGRVFDLDDIRKTKIAAIGETTATAATGAGWQVDFISRRSGTDDFAESLIEHIKNIEQ